MRARGVLIVWLRIVALISALALPSAAVAGGDVCLYDTTNQAAYILKKLKLPKRSGDAVPVVGYAFHPALIGAAPLTGTLIRDPFEGTLVMGLTRHADRCLATVVLDDDLSGTISYDCDLDDVTDGTSSIGICG